MKLTTVITMRTKCQSVPHEATSYAEQRAAQHEDQVTTTSKVLKSQVFTQNPWGLPARIPTYIVKSCMMRMLYTKHDEDVII